MRQWIRRSEFTLLKSKEKHKVCFNLNNDGEIPSTRNERGVIILLVCSISRSIIIFIVTIIIKGLKIIIIYQGLLVIFKKHLILLPGVKVFQMISSS